MNAISLTKDQQQTISRAIEYCMDDHRLAIPAHADDSEVLSNILDEFEKLAGVRALLENAIRLA